MGLLSGNGLWIYHLPLQKPLIVLWVYPPRLLLSLKCNCPPPRRRNIEKFDRPLYAQIWKRIISSGHRTTDGSTADLYYIPVDFRYWWGGGGGEGRRGLGVCALEPFKMCWAPFLPGRASSLGLPPLGTSVPGGFDAWGLWRPYPSLPPLPDPGTCSLTPSRC